MKKKNKILSAVLAVGIAVGMASMQPVQSFAATGDTPLKEIDKVVAKRDVTKKKFKTGEVVVPFKYDNLIFIHEDGVTKEVYIRIEVNGKHGYLDKQGKIIVNPDDYDSVSYFHDGFCQVGRDNKITYINKYGSEIVPLLYDDVCQIVSKDLIWVKNGDKYGCVNKQGEEVIPLQYDNFKGFNEGLAAVKKDGK